MYEVASAKGNPAGDLSMVLRRVGGRWGRAGGLHGPSIPAAARARWTQCPTTRS